MFDDRTNLAQQVTAELKRFFGEKLFATRIPRNVRLAEAPSHGKPVILYDRSLARGRKLLAARERSHRQAPAGFHSLRRPGEIESAAPVEGEEKQVVNAPRWRRWRDRHKLITMDLKS